MKKHFTFMIVPHDAQGRLFSFKISNKVIYFLTGLCLFAILITASAVVYSAHLSRKLVYYSNAIAKNKQQQKIITNYAQKTEEVNKLIDQLVQEENSLRKMLGMKNWKSKIKLSSNINLPSADQAKHNLKIADAKLAERKQSFEELKGWVNTVRSRFVSTPSRWPIYGRIVSRYGYRTYPWRGFHSGVDISGRYGAPIRVTASGVVKSTGWIKGYGKTVVVDHGYGKSTLYAHLSKYAVKRGDKVAKGQVICYVGNTGYSTGPHLHYEVKKAGKAVNPVSYLNLNILSASKIWRK